MVPFKERLASTVQRNPELAAFFKELCARAFKTGELPKRCTFRQVAPPVMADLRFIFGARAIKAQGEGFALDLAAVGLAESEARRELLQIFTAVLGMKHQNRRLQRQQAYVSMREELRSLAHSIQRSLAQKVHQQLSDDLEKQRGYLWREGVLKEQAATAMARVQAVLKALELTATHERAHSFSELGARVTGSSKSFRPGSELHRLTADWVLAFLQESELLLQIEDVPTRRARVWEQLGVEQNGAAIMVMAGGPLVYQKQGRTFSAIRQHFELGEPSTLSLTQLAGIERIAPLFDTILTIENLTPFTEAVQQPPLSQALMIYTEGFPNRAVCRLLQLCRDRIAGLKFLHWGDTDLAGVRILRNLAAIIGEAPAPFRCGAEEIAEHQERLIRLTPEQRASITRDLNAYPQAPGHEILQAVLRYNGWLEQEAWERR